MARTLYIRPVYKVEEDNAGTIETLTSIALCTTNGEILVDGQILEHFPKDEPGVDIKACGMEFHDASEVVWGKSIENRYSYVSK